MTRLIDTDNMVSTDLTDNQMADVLRLIDDGEVKGIGGEVCESQDCLDLHGDICVDEDMYDEIRQRLRA